MNRRLLLSLVAVAAVAAIVVVRRSGGDAEAPRYRTTEVERGDLVVAVTASGTVQPVTQVQVGTQVSGTIQTLFADFNSMVRQGEVVAQLDPASYEAKVESDKANMVRAEADVTRVQALAKQAENEARRMTDLISTNLVTASEYDAAIADRDSLLAQIKVAEATVKQQRATLAVSQVNLAYCTIRSPIDGIVVSRSVDKGQTVAASLSAPTIFIIAADLEKMQVQAAVTEADIGRLKNGVPVTFNVDAYPGETFRGSVSQVRLAPTTVQNVVTYTVLVDAANPGGRLLPGMTADLVFELDRRDDALLVPDSALRFTPEEEGGKGSFAGRSGGGEPALPAGGESGRREHHGRSSTLVDRADGAVETTTAHAETAAADAGSDAGSDAGNANEAPPVPPAEHPGRVWLSTPEGPRPVDVVVAQSDGLRSAVIGGPLKEGDEVITGVLAAPGATTASNPFAPTMGGRSGGGRGR